MLASDAFFPFADGPEIALEAGIGAIIQPGGSKRDDEVVAAVRDAGAAMVFAGPPALPALTFGYEISSRSMISLPWSSPVRSKP